MLVSPQAEARVVAFTKYARFIAEKFNVTVQLDGFEAHTDGAVITLPNVASMADKDLDALYAVLLHEVGHIRYTSFDAELFKRIPTRNCFTAMNAIEDARVENLLLTEFPGASDILSDLYRVHIFDPDLTERLFGFTYPIRDPWQAVCLYSHAVLLSINVLDSVYDMFTPSAAKFLSRFVEENDLDTVLASSPMVTQDDALELALDIYQRFFSTTPDTSPPLNFAKTEDQVAATRTAITDLPQSVQDSLATAAAAKAELKELTGKIKEHARLHAPRVARLQKDLNQIRGRQQALGSFTSLTQHLADTHAKLARARSDLATGSGRAESIAAKSSTALAKTEATASRRIAKAEARVAKAESALAKATPARLTEAQEALDASRAELDSIRQATEAALAAKQEKASATTAKVNKRVSTINQKVAELEAAIKSAQADLAKATRDANAQLGTPDIASMSQEDIDAIASELSSAQQLATTELASLAPPTQDLEKLKAKVDSADAASADQLSTYLETLENKLASAGLPGNVLPPFEPTPQWPEVDVAQQEFDATARASGARFCQNGSTFGTNTRDMLLQLDRAEANVQELDLANHFTEAFSPSPLSRFVNSSETTASVDDYGEATSGIATHSVLTTAFDTIRKVAIPPQSDVMLQLATDTAPLARAVRAIARTRLRFAKKPHFRGNKEEGSLDARNMWKLASRTDDHFFEINRPRPHNTMAASILVDVSGSMDKPSTEHGERLRQLSFLLSEALSEVHVRHEILGYHAPLSPDMRAIPSAAIYNRRIHSLETIVYRSFTDTKSTGLTHLAIHATDNSDGESLRIALARLRRQSARSRVMFVISDGAPYMSGSSTAALDADLALALTEADRAKVRLFALGFISGPEAIYGDRYTKLDTLSDILPFLDRLTP